MAATLHAKVVLNDKPFQTALARMKNKARQAGSFIKKSFATASGVAGGIGLTSALNAAGASVKNLTLGVVDNAAALAKVSRTTGIAVRDLAILQDVFEENQSSLDGLTTTLVMMEKSLSTMKAADLSKMFGDDIGNKSPAEKFIALSKAISSMDDPLKRFGAAQEFFGKSAKEILPIMDDVAKIDLTAANKEAETLEKMGEGAREAKRAMTQAKDAVERFGVGLMSKLTPWLTKGAAAVTKWGDAVQTAGEKVGGLADGLVGERPMESVGHDPFAKFKTAHSRKNSFLDYALLKKNGLTDPNVSAPSATSLSGKLQGLQLGNVQGSSLIGGNAAFHRIRRGDAAAAKAKAEESKQSQALEEMVGIMREWNK